MQEKGGSKVADEELREEPCCKDTEPCAGDKEEGDAAVPEDAAEPAPCEAEECQGEGSAE